MSRRRRILLSAGIVATCIAVALGVLAMLPRSAVTEANFDRIEDRMTKADVEKIFGVQGNAHPAFPDRRDWRADDGSWALVWFLDDCVAKKEWVDSNNSIIERTARWLFK